VKGVSLSQHYDKRASSFGRDYRACDYHSKWSFLQRQQVILNWVCHLRGRRILDVGCGPGLFAAELANENFLAGLDISERMLSFAKETLRPIRGEGLKLPFQNESFDVVLAVEVLQHIESLDIFLKELNRVAKQEGQLVLSSLNPNSILHRALGRLGSTKYNLCFYSLTKISAALAAWDWRVKEARFIGFPLPITWKVTPEEPQCSPFAASWAVSFERTKA
jgi:ubiquinone/menaquinone biosynthesis C-methylase UbiE